MRRDLWRLVTPLLALGTSFVIVLIIGAASVSKSPHPKLTVTQLAQHSAELTIMAVVQPTGQGQSSHSSRSHSLSHPSQHSRRGGAPSATNLSSNRVSATASAQPTSKSPSPSTSSSSQTKSASPTTLVLPGGSTVAVLNATTLRPVVTNHLNSHNSYAIRVPLHSYLVCLRPPTGWRSALSESVSLGGWICVSKHIGPGGATVTFSLVPPSVSVSGAER